MDRPRRASAEGLAAPLALLAVLVGYLPGCAMHYPWHEWWEIIELSQEGSHRQALEIFEREFPDGTSNEAVLFLACEGYYYVRDYAKFQSCSRCMVSRSDCQPIVGHP